MKISVETSREVRQWIKLGLSVIATLALVANSNEEVRNLLWKKKS